MQKLTAQNLSEAIAQQLGLSKKISDTFVRAFADTIIEGLFSDGVVKVKGLGTFKAVDVEARESVSVKTGERIIIPGFKKLSFTAEESLTERISSTEQQVQIEEQETKEEEASKKDYAAPAAAFVSELPKDEEPIKGELPNEDEALKRNYAAPAAALVSELPKDEEPIKGELPTVEEKNVVEEKEVIEETDVVEETNVVEETKVIEEPIENKESSLDKLITEEEQSYKKFLDSLSDAELIKYLEKKITEEEPMDDFSGIDDVISTPESLNELKEKLKDAQSRCLLAKENLQTAIEKVDVAKDALRAAETNMRTARVDYESLQATTRKLEKLLNKLEKNLKTVVAEKANSNEAKLVDKEPIAEAKPTPVPTPTPAPKEEKVVAPEPAKEPKPVQPEAEENEGNQKNFLRPLIIGLVLLAAVVAAYFFLRPNNQGENVEKTTKQVVPDSIPAQAKPEKQYKIHVLERGEYLTKISIMYYGTKDSVDAILRLNNFENPDVIEPGTEIKLP
ncbi:MAG: HU family DNA-binding protein [Bacteroidaceae bacterium]|nr:HU family DNA-binding protein [Bacteroidaceae bacterium]